MKKIVILFVLLLLLFQQLCFSQNKTMDSLKTELQNAKQDTIRLKIYFALCEACDVKDILKYGKPALELSDKLIAEATDEKKKKEYLEQRASAYYFFIAYYNDKNDTAEISEFLQKILSTYQDIKDTDNIVGSILEISNYYKDIGDFPKVLEFSQKALTLSKDWNYKKGIARSLYHIADIYRDQGEKIRQ